MNDAFRILLLIFGVFLLSIVHLILGSSSISAKDIWLAIIGDGNQQISYILLQLRIPKLLTIICCGICIPLSGLLMQTFFRNVLAGPYILGVSAGASLGVALFIFFGSTLSLFSFYSFGISLFSVLGAIMFLGILILVAKNTSGSSLLIFGILLASFTTAIIALMEYFSPSDELKQFIYWTFGALGGLSYQEIILFGSISILGLIFSLKLSNFLDAILLGEQMSHLLGVRYKYVKYNLLIITGILTGITTALVGPILFIGIIIPYLARKISPKIFHRHVIIYTVLLGVLSLLLFDICSNISEIPLPINITTALVGVPGIFFILWNLNYSYEN